MSMSDELFGILRKAVYVQTDLDSAADGENVGAVIGEIIAYCQDGCEGIAIVPMYYLLDLGTGEVFLRQ